MLKPIMLCCTVWAAVSFAYGQESWDIARTTIAGKKVEIEYGRPVLKGRSLDALMQQLPPDTDLSRLGKE